MNDRMKPSFAEPFPTLSSGPTRARIKEIAYFANEVQNAARRWGVRRYELNVLDPQPSILNLKSEITPDGIGPGQGRSAQSIKDGAAIIGWTLAGAGAFAVSWFILKIVASLF